MKNYKMFDAYITHSVGVWYFVPDAGVFRTGKPCKGFGYIKYAEGSVYTGDLFYDGKNFNKLGYGQQDFSNSDIGKTVPALGEKKVMFVGRYDYRKTDWIYGNGVVYYTYENGKPSHFRKGFFRGLDKIKEYQGEFDYRTLLNSYTPDMEFDFDENAGVIEARRKVILSDIAATPSPYTLFVGDSYFELFSDADLAGKNVFGQFFNGHYVNAGICGSKFSDWLTWADIFEGVPAPEKIVINLGFNDLHTGASVAKIYSDFKKFTAVLHGYFSAVKIYLISVVHAPNCTHFLEKENEFNLKLARNAERNGVTVGEWNRLIEQSGENCFHSDAIHLNEYGYGLFAQFLNKLLNR